MGRERDVFNGTTVDSIPWYRVYLSYRAEFAVRADSPYLAKQLTRRWCLDNPGLNYLPIRSDDLSAYDLPSEQQRTLNRTAGLFFDVRLLADHRPIPTPACEREPVRNGKNGIVIES